MIWATKEEINKILTPEGESWDFNILTGQEKVYTSTGILTNSGKFDGLDSEQAKKEIIKYVKNLLI